MRSQPRTYRPSRTTTPRRTHCSSSSIHAACVAVLGGVVAGFARRCRDDEVKDPPDSRRRLAEERARGLVPLGRHRLQLGDGVSEGDGDDVVAAERGHEAEAASCTRSAAWRPKRVASTRSRGVGPPRWTCPRTVTLRSGALLDLAREGIADTAQPHVAELVGRGGSRATVRRARAEGELAPLAHDHDREVLARS